MLSRWGRYNINHLQKPQFVFTMMLIWYESKAFIVSLKDIDAGVTPNLFESNTKTFPWLKFKQKVINILKCVGPNQAVVLIGLSPCLGRHFTLSMLSPQLRQPRSHCHVMTALPLKWNLVVGVVTSPDLGE